ncbi:hypothetical protein GCM10018790_79170 [Kitasatospora xanthocidica]|uniref:hypothetical protein n=1 Tax=Kitasatospora xanthocidica TaxID=83382 RepID=UPI0016720524|nr:hypothetical protein [Kitasatospora xanthocidica]GHF90041.1 hypothetical protein GCM10018790_79170 [Kitasatospora xanthocidica]
MTTTDPHDLANRLAALADEPAPPPGFDAGRSLAEGATRLRRRRQAMIGIVAGATAAVVAGGALLLPGSGTAAPARPAAPAAATTAPPPPAVTPSPTAAPDRAGSDPLTPGLRFGWLPDWVGGENGVGYQTGFRDVELQASGRGENAPRLRLSQFPAGARPPVTGSPGSEVRTEEAEPVDGRAAYWVVSDAPPYDQPTLRWLTPSGGWAELSGSGGRPADIAREVLHKVAAGVRYGTWDVPLPVRITGLPATFKATNVQLARPDSAGRSAWSMWLMLEAEGKTVWFTVKPSAPGSQASPTGKDGSPYTGPNPPQCSADSGVQVCVGAGADLPPSLEQLGGLPWLLAHTKALGPDPGTWTTDVMH